MPSEYEEYSPEAFKRSADDMRIVTIIFLVLPFAASSQHADLLLDSAFLKATVSVHARTFFMATINKGNFSDYYALAAGGA